ncbi:hypothetical protein [Streptomyces flaveolus]|uniref:hypothetical protein n=1 Tax=Streptomyces flaveolus TaxID=67297 RepID=UPI0036FB3B22
MNLGPRLVELDATADEREPTEVYADQMAVIADNLLSGYLRNPSRTDACCAATA